MVTQAILHIGLHHTGTTSFQLFLNKNRAELRRRGVSVYRPLNNGINGSELKAAAQLRRGASHFESVKSNILAQCSTDGPETFIVSAESLSSMSAEFEIRRLRSLFPDDLPSIRIIIVMRDEADWARRHWESSDHEEMDADKVRANWNKTIDGYRAVFGDVEMLTYQRTGMVELLCEQCGIDITALKVDYAYHRTTGLKRFMQRRFPGLLRFYSRRLANSMLGRAKRKLFNE